MNDETSLYRGNKLWEGSRMILPEHRERLLDYQRQTERKQRPILDEQEMEQISLGISESLVNGSTIELTVFNDFDTQTCTGIIKKIDQQLRRIKIENGDEVNWVKFEDIVRAVVVQTRNPRF